MRIRSGYPELLVCTLTWGSLGVVRRHVSLSSGTIVFFRLALGAVVVAVWLAARGRIAELRPDRRPALLAASGAILGAHWVLEFEAFRRLDVAAAILIVFVGPVLAALAAPAVLGERLRAHVLGALALAVGGILLISLPRIHRIDAVGLAAALASGVLFAALLLVGKLLTAEYEPAALVVWQLAIGAAIVSPALAGVSLHGIARGAVLLSLLGLVFTGVLGILYFRALRALEAQRFGVIAYLEPASAVLYAWVFLSERPTAAMLAGGALVVAAGVGIITADRSPAAPAELPAGDPR